MNAQIWLASLISGAVYLLGAAAPAQSQHTQGWFCPTSKSSYPAVNDCDGPWTWIGSCPPTPFPRQETRAPFVTNTPLDVLVYRSLQQRAAIEQRYAAAERIAQEECDRREAALRKARMEKEIALATAQKAREIQKLKIAVEKQLELERERGYKRISFEDFKLDGKELADTESKLAMSGFYLLIGDAEYLFPSIMAIAILRDRGTAESAIGLLTQDAERNIRRFLLNCRNNPVTSHVGCFVNVLGRASMCRRITPVGSIIAPCLRLHDGWALNSKR